MVLDLSYVSDSDDDAARRPRGYSGALVSPSLGSDSDSLFRMPSPAGFSTAPTKQRVSRNVKKEASPDSSVDELIDDFRASASSFKFSSLRDVESTTSPRRKAVPARPVKSILRRDVEPHKSPRRRADEAIGLSPMPKLTQLPKKKPTLTIPSAPPKPSFTSKIRPPTKITLPKASLNLIQLDLDSPPACGQSKLKNRTRAVPSPRSSSSSNQSPRSSVLEDIEAPDTNDTGESSVDESISGDLRQLCHLVSSSQEKLPPSTHRLADRSPTKDDGEQRFRSKTRFRDRDDEEHISSFRLYSPHDRPSAPSPVRFQPAELRVRPRDREHSNQEHDDPFVEELRTMKAALLKEKEKKKNEEAEAKKKLEDEEKMKESQAPGSAFGSLRDAVDAIDKDLLLALRPFEKIKKEQEEEDDKVAAAENKADLQLDLPMATQTLVEQLEQAFGSLTRQREADLKADEEAAAQAKAAAEAKKKEDDDKKALEEAERKRQQDEILSLLPMRGKLMNTDGDIHDALVRLELAETLAQTSVAHLTRAPVESAIPTVELANLRDLATRRAREIEEMMMAPFEATRIDWHRDVFGAEPQVNSEHEVDEMRDIGESEQESFSDVVKTDVMEKLDFTILKLKHALAVDKKEAEEAAAERKRAEAEAAALKKKKADEVSKQLQLESDATAARQRVMGLSSLQELHWVAEADARLHQSTHQDFALQRLQTALDAHDRGFFPGRQPSAWSTISTPQFRPTSAISQQSSAWRAQPSYVQGQDGRRAPVSPHDRFWTAQVAVHERLSRLDEVQSPKRSLDQHRTGKLTGTCPKPQNERLIDMKRTIFELQNNRREKAQRLHASRLR